LHFPKCKKGDQPAALHQFYFKFFFIPSTTSITFSRWPKADNREYPSLLGLKPLPGVPTTLHPLMDLSKKEKITSAPAATVLTNIQKVNQPFPTRRVESKTISHRGTEEIKTKRL